MAKKRLSKLQKWILTTLYKEVWLEKKYLPTYYSFDDEKVMIIHVSRIKLMGLYREEYETESNILSRMTTDRFDNLKAVAANKLQVSMSRSITNLWRQKYLNQLMDYRGTGRLTSHRSEIELTDEGIAKAKELLNVKS